LNGIVSDRLTSMRPARLIRASGKLSWSNGERPGDRFTAGAAPSGGGVRLWRVSFRCVFSFWAWCEIFEMA